MVYHPPHNSHDGVLLGAQMHEKIHIWVSVCVVINSTRGNNFQYIHLYAFHCNIKTTNGARNQNPLSIFYLLHPSIHPSFEIILF